MTDAKAIVSGDAPGSGIWERVFTGEPPPLDLRSRPGGMDLRSVRSALASARHPSLHPDRREVLEGLALLWHGHWEEAHGIAQSREGERDFDLLHAILHRGEGDFANAGYWFRSVGKHPCYAALERALAEALPAGSMRSDLLPEGRWSPSAFIAMARGQRGGDGKPGELIRIQAMEFLAFADWLIGNQ